MARPVTRGGEFVIEQMTLRDLGVIAEATLPIGPGFTAITGETGAGKTMVVTGLGLLLGQRSDSGAVRAGATREEAAEAIGVTFLMGGGPATVYGPRAYDSFCEFADAAEAGGAEG